MTEIISRKEAIERGLKRYFTGEPCKNGHVAERYTWYACVECYRLHDAKLERRAYHREIDRAWRKSNPDRVSAKNRRAYLKAQPKLLLAASEYRNANREAVRARNRLYHSQNKEKLEPKRIQYYQANKADFRMRNRIRTARQRAAEGRFTRADVAMRIKLQRGRCAYCKTCIKRAFEIDHVQPITKGGTNWPSNIQLTCPSCNSRKGNKEPERFARELGMLI